MLTVIPAIAISSELCSVILSNCNNCTRTVIGFPQFDTQRTRARLAPDGCPIIPISHPSGTCLVTDSIQVGER